MKRQKRDKAMPRRAYSYLRYSSAAQRQGHSKRRQTDGWADIICKDRGFLLADHVISDEAMSALRGRNADVGNLGAFLDDIGAGVITPGSVLLVESLDRLSREDVFDAFDLFRRIIQGGVSIITREPARLYDAEKPFDLLQMLEVLFIFARAHEESRTKAFRVSKEWEDRRAAARASKAPRGANVPAWLTLSDHAYKARPGAEATLRAIFEKTVEGYGQLALVSWLQSRPLEFPPLGISARWTLPYVHRILSGREVLGEYQPRSRNEDGRYVPDGPPIRGYYPALVKEDLWDQAQAAREGRTRRCGRPARNTLNLFTGIAYHAVARLRVSLQEDVGGAGDRRYFYLGIAYDQRCQAKAPPGPRWTYQEFEDAVLTAIDELTAKDVLPPGRKLDEAEARIGVLKGRLIALNQRRETLRRKAASLDTNDADAEDAMDVLRRLREEQEQAAAELKRLELQTDAGRNTALAQVQSLVQLLRASRGTAEEEPLRRRVKAALRRVVDEVWCLAQPISRQKRILHIQIYLKSGVRRYIQAIPSVPPANMRPWQLGRCDFRAGDTGDAATAGA